MPLIKVHIHRRSGKFLGTLELPNDATTDDLKDLFYSNYHFYPERQWYNIGEARGPLLKDGSLASNGVTDGTDLFFKDLGVQISWRLVFVCEYLGPLVIVPLLWCLPQVFYPKEDVKAMERGFTQKLLVFLLLIHFVKREIETLFVHRFSNATMPVIRIPVNCGHYWILCGLFIGYFVCHPKFQAPFNGRVISSILAVLFLICEGLNFKTHLILRALRPRGTKVRGIPQGFGFDQVSCANYLWETLAWVIFSIMSSCFTSYVFTIVAFIQMTVWAFKKHKSYIQTFPTYSSSRKAIIPGLL